MTCLLCFVQIQLDVIKTYLKATSAVCVVVAFSGIFLNIGSNVGSSIWLSEWSNDALKTEEEALDIMSLRIGIYSVLGFMQGVALFMINVGVLQGTVVASRTMHKKLLSHIMKSPMTFFDTTPLGRLINRFSKDIDTLDDQLRMQIQFWMMQFSPIVATIVVVTYSTPIFIVVVIPLLILFVIIQVGCDQLANSHHQFAGCMLHTYAHTVGYTHIHSLLHTYAHSLLHTYSHIHTQSATHIHSLLHTY